MLALSLLGRINFTLNGTALIDFESDKARALLIYLAMGAGYPHRREQLSAVFWPEHDERSALQNLRKTLHRLRQTLRQPEASAGANPEHGSTFLLVTSHSVQFNRASDHELDVNRFEELIAKTQTHRHRRLASCRACMDALGRAVELYRGDFLAGFTIKGGPAFDEWAAFQRERLRLQALDALSVLAGYHERRAEYGGHQCRVCVS